jgi:hypothetical protein
VDIGAFLSRGGRTADDKVLIAVRAPRRPLRFLSFVVRRCGPDG